MQTRRREGESPEIKIRKFFRDVQQSGVLSLAKNRRFFSKDISRNLRRKSAARRAIIRKVKRGY